MNQDGDATPGEVPSDRFSTTFTIVSFVSHIVGMTPSPGSTLTTAPAQLTVEFSEDMNRATFTDQTVLLERSVSDGTFDNGNDVRLFGVFEYDASAKEMALDISPSLSEAGSYDSSTAYDYVDDVFVAGSHAYALHWVDGFYSDSFCLSVIDVSDVESPSKVGSLGLTSLGGL